MSIFHRDFVNEGCDADDYSVFCYVCGKYDDDCECDPVDSSAFCPTCEEQHPCRCEFEQAMLENAPED